MNTPETDKLEYEQECNFEVAWEDHCRRLETERNEARKQRDELQIMNDQLCEAVEKTFPKIESIVKQRDELLAALQILTIACEMDYCSDDTEIGEMRCDDDECVALGVDGDRNSFITFGMIRLAKQAIANVKGETE